MFTLCAPAPGKGSQTTHPAHEAPLSRGRAIPVATSGMTRARGNRALLPVPLSREPLLPPRAPFSHDRCSRSPNRPRLPRWFGYLLTSSPRTADRPQAPPAPLSTFGYTEPHPKDPRYLLFVHTWNPPPPPALVNKKPLWSVPSLGSAVLAVDVVRASPKASAGGQWPGRELAGRKADRSARRRRGCILTPSQAEGAIGGAAPAQLWPSCASQSREWGVGPLARAALLPPPRLRGPRASAPGTQIGGKKLLQTLWPVSPAPPPGRTRPRCGAAGNSEGRSAGRDGEWGGPQRTPATEACRSSASGRRGLRVLDPPRRPVAFSVVPMEN